MTSVQSLHQTAWIVMQPFVMSLATDLVAMEHAQDKHHQEPVGADIANVVAAIKPSRYHDHVGLTRSMHRSRQRSV